MGERAVPAAEMRVGILSDTHNLLRPRVRRFHLPLTLAILTVAGRRIVPEILAVE